MPINLPKGRIILRIFFKGGGPITRDVEEEEGRRIMDTWLKNKAIRIGACNEEKDIYRIWGFDPSEVYMMDVLHPAVIAEAEQRAQQQQQQQSFGPGQVQFPQQQIGGFR